MATGAPSSADRELAAAIGASPSQVERWREAGYLLSPIRRGRGRGRGIVAVYSSEAVEQAREFAAAVQTHNSLDVAALAVFLRGHSVKERTLKRAYLAVFDTIRKRIQKVGEGDPRGSASRLASAMSRRSSTSPTVSSWRSRLAEIGVEEDLGVVLDDLIVFMLGAAESDETLYPGVYDALGVADAQASLDEDGRRDLDELHRRLNLGSFRRAIEAASYDELLGGRDRFRAMLAMLAPRGLPPETEFALAIIGVPMTLIAGSFLGAAFATGIATLTEQQ